MKRLAILVCAVALIAGGLFAGPAAADQPFVDESSVTFPSTNPCSGDDHIVTLNFTDRVHQHGNNFLFTSKRTGSTNDGFVIRNGTESLVDNGHVARGAFVDNWVHPTTGEKFQARGNFTFNIDQLTLRVDRFSLRCVGAETILP